MKSKPRTAKPSSYTKIAVLPSRLVKQRLITIPVSRQKEAFILILRGRPDSAWLQRNGRIAKALDLPVDVALGMVRSHTRKLCGNRNGKWLRREFQHGYGAGGLNS